VTDFAKLPLEQFFEELASSAPTPGGGTAAAAAGASGAALAQMVATLTLSREKFAASHDAMRAIQEAAALARLEFLRLAREDAEAYDAVVQARRLPKETEDQKATRGQAIALANRRATEIPMQTARLAVRLLNALPELVERGAPGAVSDAGTAALLLEAAAVSALLNVGINLPGVPDPDFIAQMNRDTADLNEQSLRLRSQVVSDVRKRF
jgi:formiminotetrahydrofolate cyclodeaminase